jgi:hypothetical protein
MLLAFALAQARELVNDGCQCDGTEETVYFISGFDDGECFASVFVPQAGDYPFTPEYMTAFIGNRGDGYFDVSLYPVDGDNKPSGAAYFTEAAYFTGSEDQLSQVFFVDLKVDVPTITEGNVALSLCFDGHEDYPTIARDADGLDHPDRSWIRTNVDSAWHPAGDLGVTGDWIQRLGIGGESDADADADADTDADADADTDTDIPSGELELYAISPASTKEGVAVDVVLLGGGFVQGAEAHVGGLGLTGTTVQDSDTISGRSPTSLPAGTHDVEVVNPDGTAVYLAAAFTVEGGGCGCGTPGPGAGLALVALGAMLPWLRRRA